MSLFPSISMAQSIISFMLQSLGISPLHPYREAKTGLKLSNLQL